MLKSIYIKLLHFKHTYKHYFAHHPLCDKYRSHTYKIGNVYLCKGCTHTHFGMALFLFVNLVMIHLGNSFVKNFYSSYFPIVLMCVLLTSLVADIFKITVPRPLKNILRQMLGYFVATAILALIYSTTWVKIICLILAIVTYVSLRELRKSKRHNKCKTCEELSLNKTCSGFKLMINSEIKFSKEAGDYLQKKYYNKCDPKQQGSGKKPD